MPYLQRRGDGLPNPIQQAKLRIRLVYPPDVVVPIAKITDRPAKNMEYTIEINTGGKYPYKVRGTTGEDGLIEREIGANAKSGVLTVWTNKHRKAVFWRVKLEIGGLDSVHSGSRGVAARLNNLGLFNSQGLDGASDEQTLRARARFAALFGVPDGTYIEDRIEEVHGS